MYGAFIMSKGSTLVQVEMRDSLFSLGSLLLELGLNSGDAKLGLTIGSQPLENRLYKVIIFREGVFNAQQFFTWSN
jgi:hypothetical protein